MEKVFYRGKEINWEIITREELIVMSKNLLGIIKGLQEDLKQEHEFMDEVIVSKKKDVFGRPL